MNLYITQILSSATLIVVGAMVFVMSISSLASSRTNNGIKKFPFTRNGPVQSRLLILLITGNEPIVMALCIEGSKQRSNINLGEVILKRNVG